MAFNIGTFTMFDDTNSVMDPVVTVLAKAINLGANKGAFFNALGAPPVAISQERFEVYSRSKTTRAGVVGNGSGTGWGASATTSLPVPAASLKGLTTGVVMKVESEITIVKSVNRSANTIDVFGRGLGGTTAATHADTKAFVVIGFAAKPTDLKNVESLSENTIEYTNYVQTVYETIDYTQRAKDLARKGVPNGQIIALLQTEAMMRVADNLSVMAILGQKQLGTTGAIPYMTAGLLDQLADTVSSARPILSYNAGSTALTETILRGCLQEVFNNGSPDTIWCSAANKEKINGFASSSLMTIGTTGTAGIAVDSYNYEGVLLNVKVDTDMPIDKVAIVNQGKCYKGWLIDEGLRIVEEPAVSSEEKRESVKGAVGIAIEDVGYEHSFIYGLTA